MIHRRTVLLICFCLLTTSLLCPIATAQPTKGALVANDKNETVATIAINGYDNLLADTNFIGGLTGRPETGQMLEGFIALFTQGKGLVGLDKSRPWGVIVTTDGTNFMPIGCLPVHDSKDLLQLLGAFQIEVNERNNGIVEISTPNSPPFFSVEKDGWAYISNKSEYLDLEEVPADPEQQFNPLVKDYDLAVQASFQKIPAQYRELAIEQFRAGLKEALQKEADEDDETFEVRKKWSEAQLQNMLEMFESIDQIVIGWAVDSGKQNTYFDIIYNVLPESKFAQLLMSAANGRSNYAGFYQPESAACFTFIAKTDPKLNEDGIEQIKETVSTLQEQIDLAIDKSDDGPLEDPETRKNLKKATSGFLKAWMQVAETGESAGGAVLDLSPNSLTFVGGFQVEDPGTIEESLRELATIAKKQPRFSAVTWDADQHEGITFHTLQFDVQDIQDDEEAKKLLGPTVDISVGIGKKSVYLGFGRDNVARTKEIIDSSLAQPNKEMPMQEWMIRLGPILEVAAEFPDDDADPQQQKILRNIAQMLQNESQGKDHITAVATLIENGVRLRIVVEEGVLRAFGKAVESAGFQ